MKILSSDGFDNPAQLDLGEVGECGRSSCRATCWSEISSPSVEVCAFIVWFARISVILCLARKESDQFSCRADYVVHEDTVQSISR